MDNILIPVTHAEEHLDVHAHIRRQSAMLIDDRVALLTRGIESGGQRCEFRQEQDEVRVQTAGQALGDIQGTSRAVVRGREHVDRQPGSRRICNGFLSGGPIGVHGRLGMLLQPRAPRHCRSHGNRREITAGATMTNQPNAATGSRMPTVAATGLAKVGADGPARRATNWRPIPMNSAYEGPPENGPRSP
jgi:hypothetical protein